MNEAVNQSRIRAIEAVLQRQPQRAQADGRFFLLWGALVTIGLLATHVAVSQQVEGWVWPCWVALVAMGAWLSHRLDQTPLDGSVRPEDRTVGMVWYFTGAAGCAVGTVYLRMDIISPLGAYCISMLLVALALAMAITSMLAGHKALYGAAAFWVAASLALPQWFSGVSPPLYLAACVALGYLVPGLILVLDNVRLKEID